MMRSTRLALAAAFLLGGTVAASAQNYPDRNIRLLFGFAPGVDTAARLMADKLGDALGKAVIVENVTGGSGHIAVDHVVKASPDGYTIGVMPAGNVVVDGQLYKHLPYDPLRDLVPVAQVYGYTRRARDQQRRAGADAARTRCAGARQARPAHLWALRHRHLAAPRRRTV
jgi:tripartite-type tricarboxylate transporter receptor subunit TctC